MQKQLAEENEVESYRGEQVKLRASTRQHGEVSALPYQRGPRQIGAAQLLLLARSAARGSKAHLSAVQSSLLAHDAELLLLLRLLLRLDLIEARDGRRSLQRLLELEIGDRVDAVDGVHGLRRHERLLLLRRTQLLMKILLLLLLLLVLGKRRERR